MIFFLGMTAIILAITSALASCFLCFVYLESGVCGFPCCGCTLVFPTPPLILTALCNASSGLPVVVEVLCGGGEFSPVRGPV